MDKSRVGQFLKTLRLQKRKKQFQVAMDLSEYGIEVSDKTVAKWEKGNFPDMDKLAILADYYGVKVSAILHGEPYTPQNFDEKYFIVNDEWMQRFPPDELYQTRVEQERLIRIRVKDLFLELIEKKSLTETQNDELNFLLANFYSVSDYAKEINNELDCTGSKQVKLLRQEIYREICSMHDCSVDEIYWEIKKFYNYNKRATFRKNVRGYEANVSATENILLDLENWEKDLLLAQIQTQNIADFYDKLTYFRKYGVDYDEERITKEGIKLLIKCGAQLNPALMGYKLFQYDYFSIMDRMEMLHAAIEAKLLVSAYNEEKQAVEFYWVENNTKNRLIDLYYMINCSRNKDRKISFDELYNLFISNDTLPDSILLERYNEGEKSTLTRKEQLLQAERMFAVEIAKWNECKERESKYKDYERELHELEKRWIAGEAIGEIEYTEWIGEEDGVLTESDIMMRLCKMSYDEYLESRNAELTTELLAEIDTLSLSEIRQKYFPVEERYEEL